MATNLVVGSSSTRSAKSAMQGEESYPMSPLYPCGKPCSTGIRADTSHDCIRKGGGGKNQHFQTMKPSTTTATTNVVGTYVKFRKLYNRLNSSVTKI